MTALHLNDVSVRLGGEKVVSGVTARFKPGKLYVMVGPNGAGKTTLLKAMTALTRLDGGVVKLNESNIAAMSPPLRAQHIAYLPQERGIAWDLSCVDVAALGAYHLIDDAARQHALEELEGLGLKDLADRGVFSLSGGQRARVLLARVLISPADIYLLDEPLIALDPAWQRQVLLRLKARAEAGQTVILSLHDLHLAAQFADEVLLMNEGQLVAMDKPENIFVPKLLADVFNLRGELVIHAGQRGLRLDTTPLA